VEILYVIAMIAVVVAISLGRSYIRKKANEDRQRRTRAAETRKPAPDRPSE